MNFKIEKKLMSEVIGNITKVLSVTMMLPVLKGIKIDVEENGISFTASDGIVSIRGSLNEHISKPFLFTGKKNSNHIQLLLPVRHF